MGLLGGCLVGACAPFSILVAGIASSSPPRPFGLTRSATSVGSTNSSLGGGSLFIFMSVILLRAA
jgi:hypothetical protein